MGSLDALALPSRRAVQPRRCNTGILMKGRDRERDMRYGEEGTRFAMPEQALENDNVEELKKLSAICRTTHRPARKLAIIGASDRVR